MPMQVRRTLTANNPPPAGSLAEGQLSVGLADAPPTLWAGVPTTIDPSGRVLINDTSNLLALTGGTMTGPITLAGDGVNPLDPVTMAQLDALTFNSPGRNILNNGTFWVFQRSGTITANTANRYPYTLDRWQAGIGDAPSTHVLAVSRVTLDGAARTQIGDDAATYALQAVTTATAPTGGSWITQKTEFFRRFAGRTVTLSVYARATVGTPVLAMGVSWASTITPTPTQPPYYVTPPLTAQFQRYSATFTLPSVANATISGQDALATEFVFSDTGGYATAIGQQSSTVQLWGAQLEFGEEATTVDRIDPTVDLNNCMRSYVALGSHTFEGFSSAAANTYLTVFLPTPMRATPTITGTWTGVTGSSSQVIHATTSLFCRLALVGTGAGRFFATYSNMTASAEL